MKTEMHSAPHFAFPAVIIFSLCLQTSANHTDYPRVRNGTWNPISQYLSGSQSLTEANTNPPLGINFSSRTVSLGTQTNSLQFTSSTATPNSTSLPASLPASTTGGLGNSSKPKSNTTKETCEDNKPLILICFIVIAVLVLICTFLLLSTLVMANKMSYLKKAQQGKRRPRSNGDLLATNSLWPTTAGTWQRMPKEPAGTDLIMQELIAGREAASQRKTEQTANEQENKTPKSHKAILANFVVEI
ncbi:EVI2A protein, partial [Tricholaema leucomelas]|nr:EVI2A protein [Tricholaema leucomelas]